MIRVAVLALVLVVGVVGALSAAAPLRVCSDPNNLPYSNAKREGFENRIADLIANDLGTTVEYTWWAQRRGFVRNTLNAHACDLVIGLPAKLDGVATTRPYYRSSYVFLTRTARSPAIRSFDDAALRRVRVGVQMVGEDGANSPPAHALARRHIVDNVVGFSVFGDYRSDSPPSRIVTAVANGDVDVALVWGPLAGYFSARQSVPMRIVAVPSATDGGLPLTFSMAMGVRRDDRARLTWLNEFIERKQHAIDRILDDYHVPRLPVQEAVR
jgi:mxaJ protein